jgi:hypothetical protein
LRLTQGCHLGRNMLCVSTDAWVTQIATLENAIFPPPWGGTSGGQRRSQSVGPRTDHPGRERTAWHRQPRAPGSAVGRGRRGRPIQHHPGRARMQRPRKPRQLLGTELSPLWDVHPVAQTQTSPTPVNGCASPPTKPSKPCSTRAIWCPRAQGVRSTRTRRSRAAGARVGGELPTHVHSAGLVAGHRIACTVASKRRFARNNRALRKTEPSSNRQGRQRKNGLQGKTAIVDIFCKR